MTDLQNLQKQTAQLELICHNAQPQDRPSLRTRVQRVIHALASSDQPIPRGLQVIKRNLDEDAYDDMFDNMPV